MEREAPQAKQARVRVARELAAKAGAEPEVREARV
jgi:hypothetical protein